MNCINHPDVPVAAYCQSCGNALCQECVRSIGGVVYCEACLSARLNTPFPGSNAASNTGSRAPIGTAPFVGLPPVDGPNPGLALGLGFVPGVGAMYNGQFVKGTAHVLVFALLCSAAAHENFFGFLIPFWIAYQVFDAYQTAKARRDGTPLPNPFGLNDLGQRLGLHQHPEVPPPPPFTGGNPQGPAAPFTSGTYAPGPSTTDPAAAGSPSWTTPETATYKPVAEGYDPYAPPASGFVPPATGIPGAPFTPNSGSFGAGGVPTGAVVLIGLGTLFLLSSMGIFRDEWIGRAWPLILVAIGVWLIIRRTRESQGGKGL